MVAQATNESGGKQQYWADRPKATDWTYDTPFQMPLEILIELANTIQSDAWFNVPHKASHDYIQNMAQLIKDKLDPNLKCFIEYSNEIWGFNSATLEQQGWWINNRAATEHADANVRAVLSTKNTLQERGAYLIKRTNAIFEDVFTGSDRTRLITVCPSLGGVGDLRRWVINYQMDTTNEIPRNVKPDRLTVGFYYWVGGSYQNTSSIIAGWESNPSIVNAGLILQTARDNWDNFEINKVGTTSGQWISDINIFKEYDIPWCAYEGGNHFSYTGSNAQIQQAFLDAQTHPSMYQLTKDIFEFAKKHGCREFIYFVYLTRRELTQQLLAVMENEAQAFLTGQQLMEAAPKYKAVLDANTITKQ